MYHPNNLRLFFHIIVYITHQDLKPMKVIKFQIRKENASVKLLEAKQKHENFESDPYMAQPKDSTSNQEPKYFTNASEY